MAQISRLVRKKLGDVLVEEGILKEDQLQETLKRQRATGEGFGEILASMGFLSEVEVARVIAKQFGLPYIDVSRYRLNKDGLAAVPPEFMWQNQFVVMDKIGKSIVVAVSGIFNGEVFDKLEKLTGCPIFVYVSTPAQVMSALEKHVPLNGKAKAPDPKAAGGGTAVKAAPPGVRPPERK